MVEPESCRKCNITTHADYIRYDKCGYYNCPVSKDSICPTKYEKHLSAHPEGYKHIRVGKWEMNTQRRIIYG